MKAIPVIKNKKDHIEKLHRNILLPSNGGIGRRLKNANNRLTCLNMKKKVPGTNRSTYANMIFVPTPAKEIIPRSCGVSLITFIPHLPNLYGAISTYPGVNIPKPSKYFRAILNNDTIIPEDHNLKVAIHPNFVAMILCPMWYSKNDIDTAIR